jgi:lysozyme
MTNNFIPGIDVSHHNGDIAWSRVKDGAIVFGFAKATEGISVVDTHFAANYAAMQKFQILRGAYHFFRPGFDAQAQAASFLRQVPTIGKGDLPAVLDVEVSDGQSPQTIVSGIQKWLDSVEAALGRTPIIYTSASLWNSNLGSSQAFGRYRLWIAHYTNKSRPNLPAGFEDYAFWQYSESGAIGGIMGSVDMDRFKGTHQDLERLAGL